MKHLIAIFLLALCATASAQTIKSLGYNTTNGEVVFSWTNISGASTLTFTNDGISANAGSFGNNVVANSNGITFYTTNAGFAFSAGATAAQFREDLQLTWAGLTNTNAATFQGALFSATNAAPTNTNAPTPDAWVDIQVGTNTYKLPLWQ